MTLKIIPAVIFGVLVGFGLDEYRTWGVGEHMAALGRYIASKDSYDYVCGRASSPLSRNPAACRYLREDALQTDRGALLRAGGVVFVAENERMFPTVKKTELPETCQESVQ